MANSYLNRTQGTGSSYDIWTLSMWVKRSKLGSLQGLMSTSGGWNDGTGMAIVFDASDFINIYNPSQGAGGGDYNVCTRKFRDTNAWYHIVFRADSTQGTQADRMKVYINGVQETTFNMGNLPSQGTDWNNVNKNGESLQIGRGGSAGSTFFDGYMSHVAFVDGQALAPTVFGETDSTSGIWKFKSPSGVTWGTNGFHLKFENSGALGTDSSGNSNTFTVNGNLKQAVDTPSNVYAVWNKLDWGTNYSTLSNGNTTAQSNASAYPPAIATLGVDSGKWYWEIKYAAKDGGDRFPIIGISSTRATATTNHELGHFANDWGYYTNNTTPYLRNNNSNSSWGTYYQEGDIIGVALDCTNNKLYFSKNGSWQESGDPSAGSNGISITAPSSTPFGFYFPAICYYDGGQRGTFHANFGNGFFGTTAIASAGSNGNGSLFEYDCPTGYYALNTKNINTYG
jgi:hypothetical protein